MLKRLKKMIPEVLKSRMRWVYFNIKPQLKNSLNWSFHFFGDTMDLLTGKRDSLTPPDWMNFVGPGDFKVIGAEFFNYFVEVGGLQPHHAVLEVGSGLGRMAVPLMGYLNETGSYDGIEIVPSGIRWCQKKITPRAPRFHFHLADIYNYGYNPIGKLKAIDYRFPFNDDTFDFVLLTSVFTHMLPLDMENYFAEIRRVLKKGGRCFITYFLLNPESLTAVHAGTANISLPIEQENGRYRVKELDVVEAAVAYDETYILDLYHRNQMDILPPIHYGSWSCRQPFLSFQDIVLAEKK